MEGSKIPKLLEDVLSGRPEDPQTFKTLVNDLHGALSSAPSNVKQAQAYFQNFKGQVPEGNFKYFSEYLQSFSQGKTPAKPSLACLYIVNPAVSKASKLFHALLSLSVKQNSILYNGFMAIIVAGKKNQSESKVNFSELEAKRLQCARLIVNLKCALGINMQKTMTVWQERKTKQPEQPKIGIRGTQRKNTMNVYEKKEKLLKIVKAILKASPIFEQTAFWRWKFTMQASKDKEMRFKHATELSEFVLRLRYKKEGLDMFKQNARPKWEIHKEKLWLVLRKSAIRLFYSHKFAFYHWKGTPYQEIVDILEEEQVHTQTTKIVKKAHGNLRSGKKSPVQSSETKAPIKVPVKDPTKLYLSAILRSVFKYSHNRMETSYKKWAITTTVKGFEEKKRKVMKFMDLLHGGLKKNVSKCLIMPPEPKSRETVLTNALLAICKNIIFVKSRLFNKWARAQTPLAAKYEGFLLKCLAKIPKNSMQTYFSKWKNTPKHIDAPKMFAMIATLHRIFSNKGKRVFHPPYIVKNADEIMIRTIKKIRSIIHNLYDSAFTRWHYHKIACYTREKACVFYRACQLAANPLKNSFALWREKLHARESIKRTAATSKLAKTLEKAFRGRFKALLFKSYLKIKPKKLLFRIFNFYSKKYCDETRTSFYRWKDMKESGDSNSFQILKDSATFSIFRLWSKSVHFRVKRGLYAFMKNNKPKKLILLRAFANSWKMKKIQAWDKMRVIGKAYHDKFKAFKMTTALKRAARRPQKAGFSKFIVSAPIVTGLNSLFKLFLLRAQRAVYHLRINVDRVQISEVKTVTKGLRKNVKQAQLRSVKVAGRSFVEAMKHLPKRILNTAIRRILNDEKKHMKYAIKSILSGFIMKPKEAILQWYKFMHACKAGDIMDRVKAEKLKAHLVHLVGRRVRDSYQRVTGDGNKVKSVFKSLVRSIEKKTKAYLESWKKFIEGCKKGALMDAVRSQKLKILLFNIEKRVLRDSSQRIFGAGDKIKGSIRSIIKQIEKRTKESLRIWHVYTIDCRSGKLLNAVKSEKLKNALFKVPSRTMRDAYQRLIGGGDKVKGAVRTLLRQIEKRSKVAYSMWKVYVHKCNQGSLMDGLRSQKLKIALSNIIKRTMRSADQRILGAGDVIKGSLKSIIKQIEKKTKESLRVWSLYVIDCRAGNLMNAVKSEKLKNALFKVPNRVMKDSFQRFIGGGDKVKGAVRTLLRNIEKRSKVAYNMWKVYVHKCKQGALMDGLRSQKLKIALSNIVKRTMRSADQRILGAGDVIKGSLQNIIKQVEKKTKESLRVWSLYVIDCKTGKLMNAVKSEKLKNALFKIPNRTLKDAFQRFIGGGDKVKGAVRTLLRNIEKRSKVAYNMWKVYIHKCKQGTLMDGLRSQKLKIALSNIIKRTMRNADQRILGAGDVINGAIKEIIKRIEKRPQFAFVKWKDYMKALESSKMLDALKSQKLKSALNRVPMRTLKRSFQLILGSGNQVKGAIKTIVRQVEKKPKFVLTKWNKVIIEIKHGNLFDACRTEKLRNSLNKLPNRTLRDCTQRVVGSGGKIKGAIKTLKHSIEKRPADAFRLWLKFVYNVNKGKMMDSLRAYQLNLVLTKIPKRTMRMTYSRVQGQGNLLGGVFKNLETAIKNMPRIALSKWKDWMTAVKSGKILEAIKAEKLKNALRRIPNRVLKDGLQRIIGNGNKVAGAIKGVFRVYRNMMVKGLSVWRGYIENCRKKRFMDAFRTEKLRLGLFRLTLRTLHTVNNKIIGMGNAVNGALQKIFKTCEKMQGKGFVTWKNFINLCKTKSIMDNVRSQKLKIALVEILKTTLRSTFHKMMYSRVDAKKALSYIFFVIKQRSRVAFTNWRFFMFSCKTKSIMDNLTSQKLKNALTNIPRRTLRSAYNRVIGDGDIVKGVLKELMSKLMNRPKFCVKKWRDFVQGCKTKGFMDNLRSERLKNVLSHLKNRTTKTTLSRILGGGSLAVGAFKKMLSIYKNKPRAALQKWVKYREMVNRNEIMDSLKSQKLLKSLSKIPARTLRSGFERIIGNGDLVKGAIRRVMIAFKNITKGAFDSWNKFRLGCQNKQFMDNIKSQKLKNAMTNIPRRVVKDAFQRVIGDGSKVKGALKTFFSKILKKPKFALEKWRSYIQACKSSNMLDAIRSHKLHASLLRIPIRITKDTCQRILGGGNKIKGAFKTMVEASKAKPKQALQKWSKYIQGIKDKSFMDNIRSERLKYVLTNLTRKRMRDSYLRLAGEGDKVKGALKQIIRGITRSTKVSMDKWRVFVNLCNSKTLLSAVTSQKLKISLVNIQKSKIRTVFERVVGGGNRANGALKTIFMALDKKAKLAFIDWKNFITACRSKNMLNGIRSHKLQFVLSRIPKRTINEVFTKVTKSGGIAMRIMRRLGLIFIKGPEIAIKNWKAFVDKDKVVDVKKDFENKYKALRVKGSIERPTRKVLRAAQSHTFNDNIKLKMALKNLAASVTKRNSDALRLWHLNCIKQNIVNVKGNEKKQVVNENYGLRLKDALNRMVRKGMRDAFRRINPVKNRAAEALGRFEELVRMRPKLAIAKWVKYSEKIDSNELLNNIKTLKLRLSLEGVVKRNLRNAYYIVSGDGNRVKGALKSIVAGINRKLKGSISQWKKFVTLCKEKKMFDGMRSKELVTIMKNITCRTLRDATERVFGGGDKIKGAIRRLLNALAKIPKDSMEKWRKYIVSCKNKTMFDGMRSFKLKNAFERMSRRSLKNAVNRVIGDGDIIKATLKGMIKKMIDLPKDALKKWRRYLEMIKNKQLFDGLRSQKLNMALQSIPKRTLRSIFERVLGDGNLVKGALRRIQLTLQKKTKIAWGLWNKYLEDIRRKKFFDSARSFNLKIVMTRITIRTERSTFFKILGNIERAKSMIRKIIDRLARVPKESIEKWKKFIFYCKNKTMFDGMRSFQLKGAFERMTRRSLKNAVNRVIGDGDIIKATLKGIIKKMIDLPKDALKKWRSYLEMIKNKQLFDGLRSQKLKIALQSIPVRTLRNIFERVLGDGNLVKGALRRIQLTLQKKTKIAYDLWKKYLDDIKKKRFYDNARSLNLKIVMTRLVLPTERRTFFRILGNRDLIRAMLQNIIDRMMRLPKTSVEKWKKFIFYCKTKTLFDGMRSQKLRISFERLTRRVIKDASNRVLEDGNVVKAVLKGMLRKMTDLPKDAIKKWKGFVNDIKTHKILDGLRSQKLKNALQRIPIRSLRNVSERILGEGNLIKGAIRRITLAMQKKPKIAFEFWKKFVENIKNKAFFDNARSAHLKIALQNITKRTERDACLRIIGGGNKLKAVLQEVMNRLSRIPKVALDQWKKYLQLLKEKKFLDNLTSEKLKFHMTAIPRRKLRDSIQRLVGEGDKVKGAIRKIIAAVAKKTKDSYSLWRKYVQKCKDGEFLDAIRVAKLKNFLSAIPVRSVKNVFNRVIGGGNAIEGRLKTIFAAIDKLPQIAFKRWMTYMQALKNKTMFDMMRSSKLKNALSQIPRRGLVEVFKTINMSDRVKIFKNSVKEILRVMQMRPKNALENWKNFVQACKNKTMFDMVRSQKLLNTLNRIPVRRIKDAHARIIGGGDKIKGKLNLMISKINKMPQVAYMKWKQFVADTKTKGLMDNMKSLKLKNTMEKMIRRTIRSTVERVIGNGNLVAGALRRIAIQVQKKSREGFNLWKQFIDGVKNKKFLDSKRALELRLAIERITKRTFNSTLERVIGDGSIVAGALRRLTIQVQTNAKKAVTAWKAYVQWHRHLTTFRSFRTYRFNKLLTTAANRAFRSASDVILNKGIVIKDTTSALRKIFAQYRTMSRKAFTNWKSYISHIKHGEMMDRVTSVKLQLKLEKLSNSKIRGSFLRIIGGGNRAHGMLKALAIKCLQVPRDAIKSWTDYINKVKLNRLLDSAKAFQLKSSLFHMTLRTLKVVTKRMTVGNPDVKAAMNLVLAKHKEGKKHTWELWKKFVDNCKKQLLFDQVRTERLRKKLISLPFRILKNSLERMLGDGSAVKGALRRIIMNIEKIKMVKFSHWKDEVARNKHLYMGRKLKAMKFVECMSKVTSQTMRFCSSRVIGKRVESSKVMRKIYHCLKFRYFNAFRDVKEKLARLALREEKVTKKFMVFSNKITNRTMKSAFRVVLGKTKVMNVLNRLVKNVTEMQKTAINILWGRVEKLRTIRKVNSAYYVFRGLLSYEKKVKTLRFGYWKNLYAVRRAIIMKRTTGRMMCSMSINFEGAFWKWKIIMTKTGNPINPKHSVVVKRLCKVGSNYQTRLSQFALFKLILHYKTSAFGHKLTLPQALMKILKPEGESNIPSPEKESRPISAISSEVKTAENPSNVSTMAGGLSKEEINSMNHMGSFEILSLTLKEIRLRKIAWALSAVFTYSKQVGFYDGERSRLIEQITELRYEKHSLLEDNNTLRHHNDSLVNSLEKANEEFQTMSLHLDHLRLTAMIRLLSRMAELNIHGAFVCLRNN